VPPVNLGARLRLEVIRFLLGLFPFPLRNLFSRRLSLVLEAEVFLGGLLVGESGGILDGYVFSFFFNLLNCSSWIKIIMLKTQ